MHPLHRTLYLFAFCWGIHCSTCAQTVTVPLFDLQSGVQEIEVGINQVPSRFILDTGASSVTFGKTFFQELLSKGAIDSSAIISQTRVTIANGSVVPAQVVNLEEVEVGGLILNNVSAFVLEQSGTPQLIGQSVLERFGTVTIDNTNKEVRFEVTAPALNPIGRLRFIPCSALVVTDLQGLKSDLEGDATVEVYRFEEETKIPPSGALARIHHRITIRYFDAQDRSKADFLKGKIQARGYSAAEVFLEDMTPYYPNPIPDYLEVWVR